MSAIRSKVLSDAGWKDIVAKNKVKDNGLLKVLERLKRADESRHDEIEKLLDEIGKLAAALKKDKAVGGVPAVGKYIAEIMSATDDSVREVVKLRSEADKKSKAEEKKAAEAKKRGDDEGEEDEDEVASELLTTKMTPLLRLVQRGEAMHALVAKAGKEVAVLLSRKPIPVTRRKMLADYLGGSSTRYYPGRCELVAGAVTFLLADEVAGLAKLIKPALLAQTGLRINKLKCSGSDGDDDDGDEGDRPESGGADQPPAELVEAPSVWRGTRELLESNIDELKQAVLDQCADEAPDFAESVHANLDKLDRILSKLDRRLTDSLTSARDATDPGDRSRELARSKALLAEYLRYVQSEPLISHLDRNPFGVKPYLKATLVSSLTQLAQAIG